MKVKNVLCLMLLFCFFALGNVYARLIGVSISGSFPDIEFNNNGIAKYDPNGLGTVNFTDYFGGDYDYQGDDVASGVSVDISSAMGVDSFEYNFVLDANDIQLRFPDSSFPSYLTHTDLSGELEILTDMKIFASFDNSGNFQEGYMIEQILYIVDDQTLKINGKEFYEGEVILAGKIEDMGWRESLTDIKFDALIKSENLFGTFIDQEIWPQGDLGIVFGLGSDSGITTDASSASELWQYPFEITKPKGDKAPPVPEPATILLVGAGLLGIGFFGRKRLHK